MPVGLTPEAADELRSLRARHGNLMFHQSGGCCDGSSPMCFTDGEFIVSEADEFLGNLDVPSVEGSEAFVVGVWMSKEQYRLWAHTELTIDLVPGRGAGFSLEAPDGVRFIVRSEICRVPT